MLVIEGTASTTTIRIFAALSVRDVSVPSTRLMVYWP